MNKEYFTNRESVTKSLSFELIPQGRTADNIKENKVIEYEENLAQAAEELMQMYDGFYRNIINDIIQSAELPVDAFYQAFINRKEDGTEYEEIKSSIFKEFHHQMCIYITEKYGKLDRIFDGTFSREIFPAWAEKNLSSADYQKYVQAYEQVSGCISYFSNYRVARKTLFSDNEYNTVAGRTVLENMPVFFENMHIWEEIRDTLGETTADSSVFSLAGIMQHFTYEGIESYNAAVTSLNIMINNRNQKENGKIKLFRNKLKHQILSKKENVEWHPIANKEELSESIQDLLSRSVIEEKSEVLRKAYSRNMERIFINGGSALTDLSYVLTGKWDIYRECFKEKGISLKEKHYSLYQIRNTYPEWSQFELEYNAAVDKLVDECRKKKSTLVSKLGKSEPENSVDEIREYFDAVTGIRRFVKDFIPSDLDELDYDAVFYEEILALSEELDASALAQSRIRSFFTRKPKDVAKKKRHCFGNPSIYLSGWNNHNESRITPCEQFLAVKDGKIYYGKASAGTRGIPVSDEPFDNSYEKLSFKRIVNAHMQLPKFIFLKNIKAEFAAGAEKVTRNDLMEPMTITKEQFVSYSLGEFKKSSEARTAWIDLCKEYIRISPNFQKFCIDVDRMRASSEYENLNDFYSELNAKAYRMYKQYIDADMLNNMVESGDAYLFLLYGTGRMYSDNCSNDYANILKYILSDECMAKKDVRLNSDVEVTYRKACRENRITHEKGSVLVNKTDVNGVPIPDDAYRALYLYYNGKTSVLPEAARPYFNLAVTKKADRDLIKDRRYAQDKWFINLSYKLNPTPERKGKLNEVVRESFHVDDNPNILTVIRGERDLLYYTLTGKDINESGSLNVINGTDYGKILKELTYERKNAQKNWDNSKKVVNYKDTFILQAVSFIVKKAVANDAVICIENIDTKFKQKRMCVDNQVYQKFEDMLVKRLSCFSDPHIPMGEPGSLINPLQLASIKYSKGKQNGILFKVNNARTAQADDKTGFCNMFSLKNITTMAEKRDFIENFTEISINDKDGIKLCFNYADFKESQLAGDCNGYDYLWTLNPRGFRNARTDTGRMKTVDMEEQWYMTFGKIYRDGNNLIEAILDDSKLVKQVFDLIRESLQSKYRDDNGDEWYISPVTGKIQSYSRHAAEMLEKKCRRYVIEENEYSTADWLSVITL